MTHPQGEAAMVAKPVHGFRNARAGARHWTRRRAGAVALSAVLAVAGCSGSSSDDKTGDKATGGTFTYWTSGWQPDQIAEVDAAFEKAHPGMHAKGQYIASSDQYLPRVISALKSNTQPTVLLDQNPSDLPELAQSGKLI